MFFLDFDNLDVKEKPTIKAEDPDEEIKEELKVEPPFIDEISPPASFPPQPPLNDPPILPVRQTYFGYFHEILLH